MFYPEVCEIAKRQPKPKESGVIIDLGEANEKQRQFYLSTALYTAYGGAKGGGKTHAVRTKAIGGALEYPGIKILILRRAYGDLQQGIIEPIVKIVEGNALGTYDASKHILYFINGSTIRFGNLDSATYETTYQGQEYDWIFMDEATQFCVHPDTEVLLDSGWAKITEVKRGDKVLSLNPDGTQEFKPIEHLYVFPYEGEMFECFQKNGVSFCVTPDHRIPVVSQSKAGGWYFKTADNLKHDRLYRVGVPKDKPDVEWFTGLFHHHKGHNEVERIRMDDWLEFLGWYLSEGCSFKRKNGKSPRVCIRQTKVNPSLDALFERLPYRYSKSKDGQYRIYSGQLYDVLAPLGNTYEKRVPNYVFKLNKRQIEIFLRAFEAGDGHSYGDGCCTIGLANEGLIDDLQRLYSLCGRPSTKSECVVRGKFKVYRLSIQRNSSRNCYVDTRENITSFHYSGLIYCPSVTDNHNFLIRYKGRVSFTGNTERQFQYIRGCLRGVNDIPKRFYLTCNPGGVGHRWVKRLFIDRDFKTDSDNPEENENPDDYVFIPATIEDNTAMRKYDPIGYKNQLQILSQMPDNLKAAYRYGIWDELGGNYFPEFNNATHVINTKSPDFKYPVGWERFHRYRTFDYGFDMFACYWIAVDTAGRSYVYREFRQGRDNNLPELTASQAAQKILENTLPNENITITYAPPDIWNTQKTDGKTIAEDFIINGVPLVKANNNRVQGHMQIKEMLRKRQDGKPMLYIFDTCPGLISDLRDIQSDEKNPNDCAKDPHDITHSVDALRYYCISRTLPTEIEEPVEVYEEDGVEDYDHVMCGGEVTESYLTY